jgi:quercetin dioxygenase-like cupin family protein
MDRRWNVIVVALLAGCAPVDAEEVQAPAPAAATGELGRTSRTITGQPVAAPPSPFEVVISATELPPGGTLPMHKHPWPRYAYVERGRIRVHYEAAELVREFGPGEAVVEAVDAWHEGEVVGSEAVRLVVIDHVPPGRTNIVRR